ncbi:MAG: transcriptional regulator [Saprospiraceae bacterium]|nr:MAG: transcriptional regulator [Saprospiraceae bacterium]
MQQLTTREEQIMQIVWKKQMAFIRDIIEDLPEPKPHYNTIATIVKILVKKGFLKSELIGNVHQYSPAVAFEDYREDDLEDIKKKYFGNSLKKMFAHFAKKEDFTEEEKEELIRIIKSQKS